MDLSENTLNMICISAFLFLTGSVCGSFMTCIAYRISAGEDWKYGRSHCEHCGHVLRFADMIPVFSWILLRGRCRYCHEKISRRSLYAELFLGIIFSLMYIRRKTFDLLLLRDLILSVICLGASLTDLDTFLIPDGFHICGIINWAACGLCVPERTEYFISGVSGGTAIAGGILLTALIMERILKKEMLGGGDVKLLFTVCLYTGFLKGLMLLFLSCVSGIVFMICQRKKKIAFGPSVCIACIIVMLYGNTLAEWFLRSF